MTIYVVKVKRVYKKVPTYRVCLSLHFWAKLVNFPDKIISEKNSLALELSSRFRYLLHLYQHHTREGFRQD